jgi:hypothetical protein
MEALRAFVVLSHIAFRSAHTAMIGVGVCLEKPTWVYMFPTNMHVYL